MSGKPQYVEIAVLNAAVDVFWRHGYANASVSALTEATGLSRSSLYQRFHGKDGLFSESLQLYTGRVLARMRSAQRKTSRASIEALLREFLPTESKIQRPPGCLISRSNAEQEDLTIAGRLAASTAACQQRNIFMEILNRGQIAGEIEQHVDLDLLAWYYFGILQSIVNLPSVGVNRKTLDGIVDVAMLAWPQRRT